MPDDWELNDDLPGEEVFFWMSFCHGKCFFDGAAQWDGARARVVFVSPEKHILSHSFILVGLYSNNVAEYQALILGLQMVIRMRIKDLDVYGDAQLFINQLLKEFELKKDDLIPHHKNALQLSYNLETVKLEHVPRSANKMVDALASLAATLALRQKKASPYQSAINESSHLW